MLSALTQYRKALKVQTAKVHPCFYERHRETVIRFGSSLLTLLSLRHFIFNHLTDILQFASLTCFNLSRTFQSFREKSSKQGDAFFLFCFSQKKKKVIHSRVSRNKSFSSVEGLKLNPLNPPFFEWSVSPSGIPCHRVCLCSFFE